MIREALNRRGLLFDKLTLYLVFFIFLFIGSGNKAISYSPLFILFVYWVVNKITYRRQIRFYNDKFRWFPMLLLLAWVYGVLLGLLGGNDNVLVNNAGILLFTSYYFLESNRLKPTELKILIVNMTTISIIYYLFTLKVGLFDLQLSNLGKRIGGYNISGIFSATFLPVLIYNVFFSKKEYIILKSFYTNVFLLLLVSVIMVMFVASKGVYLSVLATLLILFHVKLKEIRWSILIATIFLLFHFNIGIEKLVIFGESDSSNSQRYAMASDLTNELGFIGKGWGATFESVLLRGRDMAGYSTELSYMNLIHKIGIVSSIFFVFYGWLFFLIVRLLKSKKKNHKGSALISLGMITYLFTSIGNPSLFAPIFVFMTVLALNLMNKELILSRNEE